MLAHVLVVFRVELPSLALGGRYGKRGDVVETGVFRPLSEYDDVTVSGVFRPLSEEGITAITRAAMPSPTTKIYIGPPDSTPDRFSTRITTGEPLGRISEKIVVPGDMNSGKIVVTAGRDSVDKRELSSKTNGIKKSDSQLLVAKRGRSLCEPSGESTQLTYRSSSSVSEVVAGGRSSYAKLESSSSSTSSGDSPQQGMHPEARDTGQQRGASPLSRASSPGSSSGSSYNLSSTTDTTQDSRVLRVTPMGSTTGLLPNSTVNSHSKLKSLTSASLTVTAHYSQFSAFFLHLLTSILRKSFSGQSKPTTLTLVFLYTSSLLGFLQKSF
ncbi:hypothetical protein C0J52_23428 [Blattella germanica]|nr:hypothetical protein C0J52_23428 [Blattella germanica]